MSDTVSIEAEDDGIAVQGPATLHSRRARLFFASILGANETADGWQCPLRRRSVHAVAVQVHDWLDRQGFAVQIAGEDMRSLQLELQRRVSFARTAESAKQQKLEASLIDVAGVESALAEFGWSEGRSLRPHQRAGLAHALAAINSANFSVPGAGKTATALAVLCTHLLAETVLQAVVVGPLSSFAPWEDETRLAVGDRIRVRRVRGTADRRQEAYATSAPGDLLVMSYATAASDQNALVQLLSRRPTMLIVDESHRIKRFEGGLWAPALMEISKHAAIRMILSGTPMPNSGRDLYSQLNVLWPDELLTGPRGRFASRVDGDFEGIRRDVDPFMSRTPKADLGLPPYRLERRDVEMGPLQAGLYDYLLDYLRQQVADAATWADKIEALRRGRPIRLLQAATNPALLNSRDPELDLPALEGPPTTLMERLAAYRSLEQPAKHEAASRLVSDLPPGEKVVIWSTFVHNLDAIASRIRTDLKCPVLQVDGRVPMGDEPSRDGEGRVNASDRDTREGAIREFLTAEGRAVLVANPASCSESISLHSACRHAVYLDRTYDCALFLQSVDRIHRLGLPVDADVSVTIFQSTLYGAPTVDHVVDAALVRKDAQMRRLLEGANIEPLDPTADPLITASGDHADLEALLRYLMGE